MYGRQEPVFRYCPPYEDTHGNMCSKFLTLANMSPLEWQEILLDDWLARTKHGRWANTTCVLSVPRQNGKTRLVAGRAAFGMQAYGEWVVYTSHLQKTSTETFEEMAAMFDTPKLRKYVKAIKTALGREEIVLINGGRCKFLARTRNGGRGQHGDLWIADEVQELSDEQQGSFLPLLAASKNPQTIYLGTPPDENASGEVFNRLRKDAQDGNGRMAYSEWSVGEIGDTADVTRWAETNPSFGYLIHEDTISAEFDQMARDRFARERLGWWSPVGHVEHLLNANEWESCKGTPPENGLTVFACKLSYDGSIGSIAACIKPTDGNPYIELIETRQGSSAWIADWIATRHSKAANIVIDGGGAANALHERLTRLGVGKTEIVRPRAADMATACSMLVDAVADRTVSHMGQEALTASATMTGKRKIGSSGFGFEPTEYADSTAIEACALALWQASRTKRNPERKLRVG